VPERDGPFDLLRRRRAEQPHHRGDAGQAADDDGMTSATWLAGLVITTNAANRVNAATPATPTEASRRAIIPIAIATTAKVRYMPSSSTVRPCVPKWCTTAFRSAAGVRSMNTAPMALTGEVADLSNAAARVETPMTTPVARNTLTAPTIAPRRPASRRNSCSACQRSGWMPASGAVSIGSSVRARWSWWTAPGST